jgi:hypothetical protein
VNLEADKGLTTRPGTGFNMKHEPKAKVSGKRTQHPILSSFPAASATISDGYLLCIPEFPTEAGRGISFGGSTFPLPYAPAGLASDTVMVNISNGEGHRIRDSSRPAPGELEIMAASSSVIDLLDVLLKSLQYCQGEWRDGIDKERIKWIDELEDAAKGHGGEFCVRCEYQIVQNSRLLFAASFSSTHADLTRLLMAGRSGEAVAQFLGGRITDKVIV